MPKKLILPSREDLDEKLRTEAQNGEIQDIITYIADRIRLSYTGESQLVLDIKKIPHALVCREVVRRGTESGWRIIFVGNNPRGDGPHIVIA